MAKLELSLTTGYVPDWGLWEGIREIIQNSMDAAADGMPASISHRATTFTCSSANAKLDRNVWLLGTTSKAGGGKYIGHFGEGLKLGVLALVRAGHKVKITNDDEIWTPTIEPSTTFASPVLTIRTRALPKPTGAFTIEVSGVPAAKWAEYKEYFLHLTPPARAYGQVNQILDGPAHAGRLYVKGIYVQDLEDYAFGYNLVDVDTDRDRKMVASWMLEYKTAHLWLDVINDTTVDAAHAASLVESLYRGLDSEAKEFCRVSDYATPSRIQPLVACFRSRFGDKAVPIYSEADRRLADHHGIEGVMVGRGLALALNEDESLNLTKVVSSRANEVATIHPLASLSHRESFNLQAALQLIEASAQELGYPELRSMLQVVDFHGEDTLGQFSRSNDRVMISIARKALLDLAKTVQVLVHEVAHHRGGDGDVHHERAEGELFSKALVRQFQGQHRSVVAA